MTSMATRTEAAAVVDRLFAALQAHDVENVAEGCTDHVVLIAPGGVEIRGRQAYAAYVRDWLAAFPDLGCEVTNKTAAGEAVVIESTARGTHKGTLHTPDGDAIPATGRTFTSRLCEVDVVRDDRVAVTPSAGTTRRSCSSSGC